LPVQESEKNKKRLDKYKVEISKTIKKHKITFRDILDKEKGLDDIFIGENWKEYIIRLSSRNNFN
jgi:hypothetical protein